MKKEILAKTYIFRKNRTLYLFIIYTLSIFWAFYLGPNLLDIILPDLLKQFYHLFKPLIILLIEYIFTFLFLMTILYPLYMLYKKTEMGYNEILISSPIKSGDIFIGEFMGLLPFHLLGVLLVGPIITSLIMQVKKLTFLDFLIIYLCLFILINLGLLIGNLIANSIEYFISIKNYSEVKKELILILISLIFVTIFYFFHYLFTFMISNPEIKNWIMIYPSFWYSNIIIFIIDRHALDLYILDIWSSCGLAIVFPILCFFFSYQISNKFYNLGTKKSTNGSIIERENILYNILKYFILKKYR
ncbi:MAG: hypothetical protein ACFFAO_12385, partial [Candidatus Hermodarchaeota archaeon]